MLRKSLLTTSLLLTIANVFAQGTASFGIAGSIVQSAASVSIENSGSAIFGSLSVTVIKG